MHAWLIWQKQEKIFIDLSIVVYVLNFPFLLSNSNKLFDVILAKHFLKISSYPPGTS